MIKNKTAIALINFICAPDNDPDMNESLALRSLLIDIDESDPRLIADAHFAETLRNCIRALDTQSLSLLRLDESLCPLHATDYAICFDDDDPTCAAIRACFPNHDT